MVMQMTVRDRFDAFRSAPSAVPAELDALWADLQTVTVEEMLGCWRGGDFSTGHPASGMLISLKWHGKRFGSVRDGHPLICVGEDGELYSNTEAAAGGHSSLWEVGFRGEVTATMVYDAMAIFDHFKKVDDDTIMGIMNGKLEPYFGVPDLYYFWLERE